MNNVFLIYQHLGIVIPFYLFIFVHYYDKPTAHH
jgi:hypothetical protein